jgi:hypothetical protein
MKLGHRFERRVDLYAEIEGTKGSEQSGRGPNSLDDLLNEAADGIEERQ